MQSTTCCSWLYLFKYSEFGFVGGIQIQFLPQSNFLQSTLLLLLPLLSDKIIYNQLFLFAIWFVFQFVVVFVFFGGIQIQFSCLIRFSTCLWPNYSCRSPNHAKDTTHVTMAKEEPGRQIIARSEFGTSLIKNPISHQIVLQIDTQQCGGLAAGRETELWNNLAAKFLYLCIVVYLFICICGVGEDCEVSTKSV